MKKCQTIIREITTDKKGQKRITLPKHWRNNYVAVKPIRVPNIYELKRRYYDKH